MKREYFYFYSSVLLAGIDLCIQSAGYREYSGWCTGAAIYCLQSGIIYEIKLYKDGKERSRISDQDESR